MALERRLEESPDLFPEKDLISLGAKKREVTRSDDGQLEFHQYAFWVFPNELVVLVTVYFWNVDGISIRQKPYVEMAIERFKEPWMTVPNVKSIRDLQYFLDLFTRDQ